MPVRGPGDLTPPSRGLIGEGSTQVFVHNVPTNLDGGSTHPAQRRSKPALEGERKNRKYGTGAEEPGELHAMADCEVGHVRSPGRGAARPRGKVLGGLDRRDRLINELEIIESTIGTTLSHEIVVGSPLYDPALRHHDDLIRTLDR